MSNNDFQLLLKGAKLKYTFDWADEVPSASPVITISSVSYNLPENSSPVELSTFTTEDDFPNNKSTVGLQGAVHGHTYQISATAVLSNGESIVKFLTVLGWDAAL